ncbi:hypothetical protein, partial [Escherichia coli]|uniref:hypothetical protein n=1 Tax=Escherichia coli TaxID=562 RepID=UPI0029165208
IMNTFEITIKMSSCVDPPLYEVFSPDILSLDPIFESDNLYDDSSGNTFSDLDLQLRTIINNCVELPLETLGSLDTVYSKVIRKVSIPNFQDSSYDVPDFDFFTQDKEGILMKENEPRMVLPFSDQSLIVFPLDTLIVEDLVFNENTNIRLDTSREIAPIVDHDLSESSSSSTILLDDGGDDKVVLPHVEDLWFEREDPLTADCILERKVTTTR